MTMECCQHIQGCSRLDDQDSLPDQSQTKVTGNILHCLKHGSRLGWLIDRMNALCWFTHQGSNQTVTGTGDVLPVPDLVAQLRLTVCLDG